MIIKITIKRKPSKIGIFIRNKLKKIEEVIKNMAKKIKEKIESKESKLDLYMKENDISEDYLLGILRSLKRKDCQSVTFDIVTRSPLKIDNIFLLAHRDNETIRQTIELNKKKYS